MTNLGKLGIWRAATQADGDFARRAEALGYGAVWLGGSPGGDLAVAEQALDATENLTVATGILNIWQDTPASAAQAFHRIERAHPGRFLLGIGAGHREATAEYRSPYRALVDFLDGLAGEGVPSDRIVLAALGPKVLTLAADRTAGAHPYLTTAEHTRQARRILGDGPLLAPEQKVVLDEDDARGRETGRKTVTFYLGLRNYVANLQRLGYSDADVQSPGSDRLIDVLAVHGDGDAIAAGVRAHLDAGADHVVVQALGADPWPALEAIAQRLL
ncbi:Putative F420-dependent oxidoreductase OS=Tsukamurella paurometabola (strain ATCC 8368 / DSM/ CCUG 35730 / CIP 100753 / JCM 10117 / KCTC 9821 / NBRC 16120/ NCIMB 702349 / NCTC 13040) OX=521096 GN=Tpau_3207 PE=4 SV=1 [Tsukamurella paurometabola]|uniref:Putative F420-dependent oxidoreductase n=1 Tax=Tsukamurella paurometabola (strain ATCC 8368 / DSM 20162 / CCUG 35730 / CIP 100753 / JCM 10117 / KCTC 9821 / NBRC 16120 / NCIMB 702349 / NCTC 13040) TaxID=521096 RepID=D5UVL2_TSUPD|nr:LLM class F420-dependent oxidoreductase [Tsukamurella paurometabola]ADG79794.1 putative F420-dependent oxidoreductase [Tsukamurella paurometabola DSM 20162]SUP37257.1 methylenetetrahydromethanopterin reductase [Tsukamurella paurometabola]